MEEVQAFVTRQSYLMVNFDPFSFPSLCHFECLSHIVFRPNLGPLNASYTSEEFELAKMFQWFWSSFSKSKDPNKNAKGENSLFIEWPRFNSSGEAVMNLDLELSVIYGEDTTVCDFWDSLGYTWLDV